MKDIQTYSVDHFFPIKVCTQITSKWFYICLLYTTKKT